MSSLPPDTLWIRRFHPAPAAGERLVCFPHAGGSASFFLPVSTALSPGVEVLAVQYPGRQDRRAEPGIPSVPDLADRIAQALTGWDDKPLTFFGHSMGAAVAFEVARRMEAEGRGPVRLFASGRNAPSRPRDENVHLRDDAGLIAELRKLNGTDSSLLEDEELLAMILPATRSDYTAIETYRCAEETQVACPVTVLVGDDDPKTTLDDARAWKLHTTGPFDMRIFNGGHFYLSRRSAEVLAVLSEHVGMAGTAHRT
ncbi:thioesterase II family protein [Streptomyces sp. SL13]|uniref:Thioesterase II family protein n=1 Tax=Streptantibioticus silvisoli TaxID=2705255 RepID=A0AA90GZT9_9ACTN|nr:thioesterase II family protein [Streptantibioticus silvisoli]MDI5968716.1 thioesterase II family protein [Streptantibioticus silvisoli]